MYDDHQSDTSADFEQKTKLQLRLHELLEVCKQRGIESEPKLLEFVERAVNSKKDYVIWESIVVDILESI